jgi:two-component system, chemotaxis family, CheB/CheR fusion protein
VINQGLSIEVGDRCDKVNLIVEPLGGRDPGLFVVAFQETAGIVSTHQGTAPEDATGAEILNRELLATRERLRNLAEELEAANEELQSSNEEYLSVNEELQSANEELETSKEELQSLNEELQTVNAELNIRNESLLQSSSDLANLFDSTSIAMLFLDRDMRIRRFTPRLLELFRLREGDQGRPISDIVTRLTQGGLRNDAEEVFKTLVPREREVIVTEGVSFLMQVRPYRDLNHVIDGVVVTFVDLTERKKHELARARLAAIVESSQDAIAGHDLNGTVISWNNGAVALFGTPTHEAMGYPMPALVKNVLPWSWQDMLAKLRAGEQLSNFECSGTAKDGQPIEVSITISPVREVEGRLTGISLVARDIWARKAAEQKAAMLLGELDHRVKNILSIVSAIISQTLRTSATIEDFAVQVEGRIGAIATAHSLLTNAGSGEISLHAILQTELAAFDSGGGKVVVRGPNIGLTPKTGLSLAMAVHELASNAAKYGALSTPSGRLVIKWSVAGGAEAPSMTLIWTEMGGPAVALPTRQGFGTIMIDRALNHELDAEVTRDFLATGLRCTIIIPLTAEFGRLLPQNGQTVS